MKRLGSLLGMLALLALDASGAHAAVRVAHGSYVGNGGTNRNITGVGFRPDVVLVAGDSKGAALLRSASMGAGLSKPLGPSDEMIPAGIRSLDADGFTVGSDLLANEAGVDFYWMALQGSADLFAMGNYTGNGNDNRRIGVAFEPVYVFVTAEHNQSAMQRLPTQVGDASFTFDNDNVKTNRIQGFDPLGFVVGTDNTVNDNGRSYHWFALAENSLVLDSATYLGNESTPRSITGSSFPPEALIVKAAAGELAILKTLSMTDSSAMPFNGDGLLPQTVLDLTATGFVVGDDKAANDNGSTIHWLSLRDTPRIDLALASAASDTMVAEADTVRFDLDVENFGPSDASAVIVDVTPSPGLTLLQSDTLRGTYDSISGSWKVGALPSGELARLTLTALVDIGTAGRELGITTALVSLDQVDSLSTNDTAYAATMVAEAAELAISMTALPDSVEEGEAFEIRARVENFGPALASAVSVTLPLPASLAYVGDSPETGLYDSATGIWTVGSLRPGSTRTLRLLGKASSGSAGNTFSISGAVGSANTDPVGENDVAIVDLRVRAADLELTATPDRTFADVADTILWTVEVTDLGPDAASNVVVDMVIPSQLKHLEGTPSQGSYDLAQHRWDVGNVAVGDTTLLELSTVVKNESEGSSLGVTATVSSNTADPNAANDSDAPSVRIRLTDLEIALTSNLVQANPGDLVTLTATATNLGPDGVNDGVVVLSLPPELSIEDSRPEQGSFDTAAGTWTVGAIGASQTLAIEIDVRIDPGTPGVDLWPEATITSEVAESQTENNFVSSLIEVLAVDLAIDKTINEVAPDEGELITYTLTVDNLGPDDATGVVVNDVLPAGVSFVSAVPSRGSYDDASGDWTIGAIETTNPATLALIATIDPGTAGSSITNEAFIRAVDQIDADAENDSASVMLTVFSADLALSQSVDDVSPNEGDPVTFTVQIENLGPNDVTGVSVSSPAPAGLTFSGAVATRGSYDNPTETWTVGSLDAGEAVSVALTFTVDPGTAGISITKSAAVSASSLADPVSNNDMVETVITVFSADLLVDIQGSKSESNELETVSFTLRVQNEGPNPATGVAVAESLAAGLTLGPVTTSAGIYDGIGRVWTVGNLAPGTAESLTVDVTVDPGTAGTTLWSAASIAASDLVDPVPANDREGFLLRVLSADLALDLAASKDLVNTGDPVEWQISIANEGPDALQSATIEVNLDPVLTIDASSPSGGSFDEITGLWALGALEVDSTAVLSISTMVGEGPAGSTLSASASLMQSLPVDVITTNDASLKHARFANSDLVLEKRADRYSAEVGDLVTFTITLANRGPDGATGIVVSDKLPDGMTISNAAPDAGIYDPLTGRWAIAALGVGTTVALDLEASVDAGTSGNTITNLTEVLAVDQADSLGLDLSDSASVNVLTTDLQVLATPAVAVMVERGDTATVAFQLKNRGPARATGVQLDLDFDPALAAIGTSGNGTWNPNDTSWSVTELAPGATAELILDVASAPGASAGTATITATVVALDELDPDPGNDSASIDLELVVPAGSVTVRQVQSGVDLVPTADRVALMEFSFTNSNDVDDTLRGLRVDDASIVLGNDDQRDQSWRSFQLASLASGADAFAREVVLANMIGGAVAFENLDFVIPAGGALTLTLSGGASILARDGDTLDLVVDAATGVDLASGQTASVSDLDDLSHAYAVNGMSAGQIRMIRLPSEGLRTGLARQKVLEVILPANGYDTDRLEKLNLVQYGTARASNLSESLEIQALEAWADEGNAVFDPNVDVRLGTFSFTGDRWELTGLDHAVGVDGLRVFVSADIEVDAEVGRTIELGLPGPPDPGVGMASDNDGPVDEAPEAATPRSIVAADRVTIAAGAGDPRPIRPGARAERLLDVVITNSYDDARTLRRIEVENATIGTGLQADLDASVELLTLRLDGNDDGALDDTDPVLGTGSFVDGAFTFSGLSVVVDGGQSQVLFVEARVSPSAADGDQLRFAVTSPSSVDFVETTTVSGSWPVLGQARTIDGMVASQVGQEDFGADTLGALEGPALAFDLRIPGNGYRNDLLRGLLVENEGTATSDDIAELRLWRDVGDDGFDPGSDLDLGPLTALSDHWQTPLLSESLPADGGGRFYVSVSVAAAPTDSVTLRLRVPVGGIAVESGNDGPVDRSIVAPRTRLLSSAPLLASLSFEPEASVVGATIQAHMVLRNVGSEDIVDINPEALQLSTPGVVEVVGGPTPGTIDLIPGASDTLRWTLSSLAPGSVQASAGAVGTGAVSAILRRALVAISSEHRVYEEAVTVDLVPVVSPPTDVAQGQTRVVPLSLTFDHDAESDVSDVEIASIELRFEDEAFVGIDVADLLASVRAVEGTNGYAEVSGFAAGDSTVRLDFSPTVRVTTSEPVTLSIQLDLSGTTAVRGFHVTVSDAGAMVARDANSQNAVDVVLQEGSYPVRSGLATVQAEVTELSMTVQATAAPRVPPGSTMVGLLTLRAENPGVGGLTADVEVESLTLQVVDADGRGIPRAADLLDRLRIVADGLVAADAAIADDADSTITLQLSPRISIPVNVPVFFAIEGDVSDDLLPTQFGVLVKASQITAIDATARKPVPVFATPDPLAGALVTVEYPASEARVARRGGLAPTTILGETGVEALRFALRHPGTTGTGSVSLDTLRIAIRDEQRIDLDFATLIDRLALKREGAADVVVTDFSGSGSRVDLPLVGTEMAAGDTLEFRIEIDAEATAPDSFFELWIRGSDIVAVDANSGLPIGVFADVGTELPLVSGLSRLRAPAREVVVDLQSTAPAVIVAGESNVEFARISLANPASEDATAIEVESIDWRAYERGDSDVDAAAVCTRAALQLDGATVAQTSSFDATTARFDFDPVLELPPGQSITLVLSADLSSDISISGLVWQLDDDSIVVTQPAGALLGIDVVAAPGREFPLRTESANLTATGLRESFANFPNPFAAGRNTTRFVYQLDDAGEVTLRIFTVRGERVATLVEAEIRAAGLHQDDAWDGRNGRGTVVRNGVYLARIEVRYADGRTAEEIRKVAVRR